MLKSSRDSRKSTGFLKIRLNLIRDRVAQFHFMATNPVSEESEEQKLPPPPNVAKKKRNLPGTPDPDAEVIALSPKTLMATNRFICEICSKGFQRDQNLQLHRRGHNLPWKLRQRSGNEVKKRVYVCPESSCVHHHPSRALGDLTGIKKHFCRKHGEKTFACDKCSKKYAVKSDWKAHIKTCGTREYRCDCGTLFSRKDSFITHRAFCEALAEENAKALTTPLADEDPATVAVTSSSSSPSSAVVNPGQITSAEEPKQVVENPDPAPETQVEENKEEDNGDNSTPGTSIFVSLFSSTAPSLEPTPLSLFSSSLERRRPFAAAPPSAHLSATALLQKAAQVGPTAAGVGLGLPFEFSNGGGALPNFLISPPSYFATKPATLDLLGLGGGPSAGGFSALMSTFGLAAAPAKHWDGSDRASGSAPFL